MHFYRQAISGHYASSHCYFIDVRGTTQENIEAEVLEVARKKLGKGVDISFQVCTCFKFISDVSDTGIHVHS